MNEGDSSKGTRGWRPWRSRAALLAGALALPACAAPTGETAQAETHHGRDTPGAPDMPGVEETEALFAGIHQRGIALGPLSAPVELVELSDVQCPYCRLFAVGVLPVLVDRYVRTGRLRVIFHNFPILGDASVRAARLAIAVGQQDRMFQFVDLLFRNQGPEGSGWLTDDMLGRVAGAVPGVDVARAMHEAGSDAVTDRLEQAARVARDFGVDGRAPSFIAGRTGEELHVLRTVNLLNPGSFEDAIDGLLARR